MCSYDQTLALCIPEWLQDFGWPKALGTMVTAFLPCPERVVVRGFVDAKLVSECACTSEGRDRRFITTQLAKITVFDSKLRAIACEAQQLQVPDDFPDELRALVRRSNVKPLTPDWKTFHPSHFIGSPKEQAEVKRIIETTTEDLETKDLINEILYDDKFKLWDE